MPDRPTSGTFSWQDNGATCTLDYATGMISCTDGRAWQGQPMQGLPGFGMPKPGGPFGLPSGGVNPAGGYNQNPTSASNPLGSAGGGGGGMPGWDDVAKWLPWIGMGAQGLGSILQARSQDRTASANFAAQQARYQDLRNLIMPQMQTGTNPYSSAILGFLGLQGGQLPTQQAPGYTPPQMPPLDPSVAHILGGSGPGYGPFGQPLPGTPVQPWEQLFGPGYEISPTGQLTPINTPGGPAPQGNTPRGGPFINTSYGRTGASLMMPEGPAGSPSAAPAAPQFTQGGAFFGQAVNPNDPAVQAYRQSVLAESGNQRGFWEQLFGMQDKGTIGQAFTWGDLTPEMRQIVGDTPAGKQWRQQYETMIASQAGGLPQGTPSAPVSQEIGSFFNTPNPSNTYIPPGASGPVVGFTGAGLPGAPTPWGASGGGDAFTWTPPTALQGAQQFGEFTQGAPNSSQGGASFSQGSPITGLGSGAWRYQPPSQPFGYGPTFAQAPGAVEWDSFGLPATGSQAFNAGQDALLQMMRRNIQPMSDANLQSNLDAVIAGQTGFDTSGLSGALEAQNKRRLDEQVAMLQGSTGSLGERFGTSLNSSEARLREGFLTNQAVNDQNLALQAWEASQGRRMQGLGMGFQQNQFLSNFGLQNAAQQLQAAQAATGTALQGNDLALRAAQANSQGKLAAGTTNAQLAAQLALANSAAANQAGQFNAAQAMGMHQFGAQQGNIFNQLMLQGLGMANQAQMGQGQQNMGLLGLLAGIGVPQQMPSAWPGAIGQLGQLASLYPFLNQMYQG